MTLADRDLSYLLRLVRGDAVDEALDDQLGDSAREYARELRTATNGVAPIERLATMPGGEELARALLAQAGASPPIVAPSAGRFRPLTLAELRLRPEPVWLVDMLLQAGTLAVLEGVDGSYKSFLALALALSVALGRPWLGRPVRQGRVLYIIGEGVSGFMRRVDAWQIANLGRRGDVDNLHVVDEMPLLWRGEADELMAAAPGPYDLVLLDTTARSLVGADENSAQDVGSLVAGAEQIRRSGATVLAVHHLNRQGETRGSTALSAAVHTRLRLKREGASRIATLTVEKQRDAEPDQKISLVARTVELGTFDVEGRPVTSLVLEADVSERPVKVSPPKLKPTSITAWVSLINLGGEANFAAWRDASGLAKTTFKWAREELVEQGYVEHTTDGPWRLTATGSKGPGGSIEGPLGSDGPSANGVGPGGSTTPLKGVDPGPSSPDPAEKDLPW